MCRMTPFRSAAILARPARRSSLPEIRTRREQMIGLPRGIPVKDPIAGFCGRAEIKKCLDVMKRRVIPCHRVLQQQKAQLKVRVRITEVVEGRRQPQPCRTEISDQPLVQQVPAGIEQSEREDRSGGSTGWWHQLRRTNP